MLKFNNLFESIISITLLIIFLGAINDIIKYINGQDISKIDLFLIVIISLIFFYKYIIKINSNHNSKIIKYKNCSHFCSQTILNHKVAVTIFVYIPHFRLLI